MERNNIYCFYTINFEETKKIREFFKVAGKEERV